MPLLPQNINLDDPAVDTTRDFCANSLNIEEARRNYTAAFERALQYIFAEQMPGDIMEFGTYSGFTARILAEALARFEGLFTEALKKNVHKASLHLFDSFEGFPSSAEKADTLSLRVAAQKWWRAGGLRAPSTIERHIAERLSPVVGADRGHVYKGFFDKTLPDAAKGRKASIVHIDCDLYASTIYVLETLHEHGCLQDGTILFFDDFYCNRANPNFGEQAALRDFLAAHEQYAATPWFTYCFAAAAFFLHDKTVTDQSTAQLA
ncbi:MAG: macrocin O-methyltransferase [Alphaproteobacteria bacterium]|nr:macrocin O-methyltransferase [Alphaproteobacteria bacterium]